MDIKITNPDKILFPKQKIKKIDLINYYIDISSLMLPYLKNRPLSVIRCHEGINEDCFFKKHLSSDKFIKSFVDGEEEYFCIDDQIGLIYQAQLGTIEFHTWGSTLPKVEKPDCMVFDLDPDKKLSIEKLRQAVENIKSILDELSLQSFLKTSGGKGYHIVIPFKNCKNWDKFYDFSRQIALLTENKWQNLFTTNLKKSERKGKIFIDYLRNNRGSTCVSPYSLRARDNAPISFPISWDNLYKISPEQININNYKSYLNNSWDNFFDIDQQIR